MRWVSPRGQWTPWIMLPAECSLPEHSSAAGVTPSGTRAMRSVHFSFTGQELWLPHQGMREAEILLRNASAKQASYCTQNLKLLPYTTSAKAVHHSSVSFDHHVNAVPMIVFIQIEREERKGKNVRLCTSSLSQLLYPNICHCANLILLFS